MKGLDEGASGDLTALASGLLAYLFANSVRTAKCDRDGFSCHQFRTAHPKRWVLQHQGPLCPAKVRAPFRVPVCKDLDLASTGLIP